jgi:hypothetical protein
MILTTVACLILAPFDTKLKLKLGDQWSCELTLAYRSSEDTVIQVDAISYVVATQNGRPTLRALYKLKESRTPEGEVVPAPKAMRPLSAFISLDGGQASVVENEDVARCRIDRFLTVPRDSGISEPTFFPPPPFVRLVGLNRHDLPADRSGNVLLSQIEESGPEPKMSGRATLTFDPVTRILMKGSWTIQNAPIPGGEGPATLSASYEVKSIKLSPR